MKKINIITLFLLLFTAPAFAQISGDVVNDNRKLTKELSYKITGHVEGLITIDISVDALGNITSKKVDENNTTVRSTPAKLKAVNHVSKFKFEPGTWFPKYHQATIVIHMVKE
ncbi:hypothetical protein [Brumimicrobium aurantiacum]|uniref:TonB C-terminal domain-containing protein n=1 Tax=Brumimicrobium aurantiacum TaxID=1737063 RepID=A0A3E1F0W5_9FLAO|nr:hypothetical protein [Brumimicrobium aurantiacum]RFC55389.1 hypothetical protein DXU93_00180 [Brumimicrobium aurantiacum]